MENWFIYALLSALFSGLHTFLQKVSVEKSHSSLLVNTINTLTSSVLALMASYFLIADNFNIILISVLFGILNGATHIIGSIIRMEGLRYIDTSVFFPLYKTIGPVFTVLLGIVFFAEHLSTRKLAGVILGILVPLLLIHKSTAFQQHNLSKGLVFVVLSALFTALAASFAKIGAQDVQNIFIFIAVSHFFGGSFALLYHHLKHLDFTVDFNKNIFIVSIIGGIFQFLALSFFILAFKGGELAVVYTINSFYILIPIVLSIIFYKEHFNARKALAIGLSILAIFFLH